MFLFLFLFFFWGGGGVRKPLPSTFHPCFRCIAHISVLRNYLAWPRFQTRVGNAPQVQNARSLGPGCWGKYGLHTAEGWGRACNARLEPSLVSLKRNFLCTISSSGWEMHGCIRHGRFQVHCARSKPCRFKTNKEQSKCDVYRLWNTDLLLSYPLLIKACRHTLWTRGRLEPAA